MTGIPYYRAVDELPQTLPIFPLPGSLLLPRGTLPLNIFEPRYVAMIEDALKGERLIGMIQPDEESADVGTAHCFSIGCAGRITQMTETDDGRYLVMLTGVARFRLERELPTIGGGYRIVQADFSDFGDDLRAHGGTGVIERDTLITQLKAFFSRKQIDANWDAIEKADDESLVTALSMVCPFQPSEKQALLEAIDFVARARTLLALLQMSGEGDENEATRQ
ncbi:MAG: LON peptidase substrate-binding domain-containing protein [Rhodospirillales bacterium]|nr:LON peptidase substrate-binding domain-containing protein [Rhodospirillales bacterium]